MNILGFVGVMVCLGLGAAAALAQSGAQVRVVRHGDDRLAGITEVDVLVRVTPDREAPCALARTSLQDVALATLGGLSLKATLSEKSASWFHTVLVTVTSTAANGSCAAAIATELVAHVEARPDADRQAPRGQWGSLLVGELSLIRESALVTAPAKAHDAAVQKVVREQLTNLGRRVRAVNP
jgi:hypothetical protein